MRWQTADPTEPAEASLTKHQERQSFRMVHAVLVTNVLPPCICQTSATESSGRWNEEVYLLFGGPYNVIAGALGAANENWAGRNDRKRRRYPAGDLVAARFQRSR